jgi:hypothetical protein
MTSRHGSGQSLSCPTTYLDLCASSSISIMNSGKASPLTSIQVPVGKCSTRPDHARPETAMAAANDTVD